ncbi:MAG: HAD hydrolase-like protein [Bacillota bacterium]
MQKNQWKHNVSHLNKARQMGCKAALATMADAKVTRRILKILGLAGEFDLVMTRDDIEYGKPDP